MKKLSQIFEAGTKPKKVTGALFMLSNYDKDTLTPAEEDAKYRINMPKFWTLPADLQETCSGGDIYLEIDGEREEAYRQGRTKKITVSWTNNGKNSWCDDSYVWVRRPFKTCKVIAVCKRDFLSRNENNELVHTTFTEGSEVVICECSPKYPIVLNYDTKSQNFSSARKVESTSSWYADENWNVTKNGSTFDKWSEDKLSKHDVIFSFGKYYGKNVSWVLENDLNYALYIYQNGGPGYQSYDKNVQSIRQYIRHAIDVEEAIKNMNVELDKKTADAIPVGTQIEFELKDFSAHINEYELSNFSGCGMSDSDRQWACTDYIEFTTAGGMILRADKKNFGRNAYKSLIGKSGKITGKATIKWFGKKSGAYGIENISFNS